MTNSSAPPCGLDAALAVMGGKWKPLILFHLADGPRRFGALRRLVNGISEKMLVQQLRELQADGIVARLDFREVPPKVEYSVTPFGQTLAEALRPLCAWGSRHLAQIETIMRHRMPEDRTAGGRPVDGTATPPRPGNLATPGN